MKLLIGGIAKFVFGILIIGLLVFVPAGSLDFVGGWVFLSLISILILASGAVLFIKNPNLLEKRLDAKEKEGAQKGVVAAAAIVFLGAFIVAGLDYRFGWSSVSLAVSLTACFLFVGSYGLYAEVLRENAYLSRTIEVQEGQKVIDTGLYGIVRHPMYLATIIMFLSIPLILGSLWAFVVLIFYPAVIVARITNEEKVLTQQLSGYAEYKNKVKYRLIPFIW